MNVSAAFIVIRAFPIMFVYRKPWYSLADPKILSIVSFRWSYHESMNTQGRKTTSQCPAGKQSHIRNAAKKANSPSGEASTPSSIITLSVNSLFFPGTSIAHKLKYRIQKMIEASSSRRFLWHPSVKTFPHNHIHGRRLVRQIMVFLRWFSPPDPLIIRPHFTAKFDDQQNRQNNRTENRANDNHHIIHHPSSSSQAHSSSNSSYHSSSSVSAESNCVPHRGQEASFFENRAPQTEHSLSSSVI